MKNKESEQMGYYRVRKNWNNGKWDSSQICAYTDKQKAIQECTEERVQQGYKVFDPDGKVVYPITLEKQTKVLKNDGVIPDDEIEYWNDIFNRKKLVHLDDLNVIINRYSKLLNKNETKIVSHNGICMLRIPSNRFQIKLVDKSKSNLDEDTYFNLGYFANFKEDGIFFTLPVANLVADTDENTLSSPCLKYLKERKVKDNKVYFYASQNASDQFKTKDVSTLIICNDNTVFIDKYNSLYDEDVKYAVSGAPIIIDGFRATTEYLDEGWDNSIDRPTVHGFLGVKDNYIYYFYIETKTSNCITSGEIYDKIKDCGFSDVIKVDGGGSFYCKINGEIQKSTSENRQINNIGVVM